MCFASTNLIRRIKRERSKLCQYKRSKPFRNVRLAATSYSARESKLDMDLMWNSTAYATKSEENLSEVKGGKDFKKNPATGGASVRKKKSSMMANQHIVYRQLIRGS